MGIKFNLSLVLLSENIINSFPIPEQGERQFCIVPLISKNAKIRAFNGTPHDASVLRDVEHNTDLIRRAFDKL